MIVTVSATHYHLEDPTGSFSFSIPLSETDAEGTISRRLVDLGLPDEPLVFIREADGMHTATINSFHRRARHVLTESASKGFRYVKWDTYSRKMEAVRGLRAKTPAGGAYPLAHAAVREGAATTLPERA